MGGLIVLHSRSYFSIPRRYVTSALDALKRESFAFSALDEDGLLPSSSTLDEAFGALGFSLRWNDADARHDPGGVAGLELVADKLASAACEIDLFHMFQSIEKYASIHLTFFLVDVDSYYELSVGRSGLRSSAEPGAMRRYRELRDKGDAAGALGLIDAALAVADEAAALGLRLDRGGLLRDVGRFEEAVSVCTEIVREADPAARARVWVVMGHSLLELARVDEAEDAFRLALALDRSWSLASEGLGLTLWRKGRFHEAIEELRPFLDSSSFKSVIAAILAASRRYDELVAGTDAYLPEDRADAFFERDEEAAGFEVLAGSKSVWCKLAAAKAHAVFGRVKEAKALHRRVLNSAARDVAKEERQHELVLSSGGTVNDKSILAARELECAEALLGLGRAAEAAEAWARAASHARQLSMRARILDVRIANATAPQSALEKARIFLLSAPGLPEVLLEEARALAALGDEDGAKAILPALVEGRAHTRRKASRDPRLAKLVERL